MTATLASRTWSYRQSHAGAELKFSTTAHEAGTYHSLVIASHGARKTFELDDVAIAALASAVESIEQDPERIAEFSITPERSLICEPSLLELVNCEAKLRFASFENLKALWDRIYERARIARLFG